MGVPCAFRVCPTISLTCYKRVDGGPGEVPVGPESVADGSGQAGGARYGPFVDADAEGPPRCGFCGKLIPVVPGRPGPAPRYCSPACRQRAHQQRRREAAQVGITDPLRVESLEVAFDALRRQLTQLSTQLRRLDLRLDDVEGKLIDHLTPEPTNPAVRRLTGLDPLLPPPLPRRRWPPWRSTR